MCKLTNEYMHKAPKGKAPGAKELVATATKSKGMGIVVPTGSSESKVPKPKKVGRRISQHKRLAMGEDIDNDGD